MNVGSLVDAVHGVIIVPTVYRTTTPWERLRGLLGRPPLGFGEGLLIDPCGSVHTMFMGYAIDLVYLNRLLIVTRVVPAVVPWRGSIGFGAAMTLELAAGTAADAGIERGLALRWREGGAA